MIRAAKAARDKSALAKAMKTMARIAEAESQGGRPHLGAPGDFQTVGRKHDDGKLPYHLIPPEYLQAVAEILDFGAKKYAPRNWEKGMDWSRLYRAACGHLFDWFRKKGPDPETGKSHLWHAACCVMFLVVYEMRGAGTDDRPYDYEAKK